MCLCDEVAETASLAGAVNTIQCARGPARRLQHRRARPRRSTGFGRGIRCRRGETSSLLGAGGAAAAALISLALATAKRISRTQPRRSRGPSPGRPCPRAARRRRAESQARNRGRCRSRVVLAPDLVVNATPVGMRADDPSPVPASWLRSGQVVADMVYRAHPTALVRAAREKGAVAVDGLGMLVSQGATAIEIWHDEAGVQAPRDVMRAAAMAALGGAS